MSTTSTNPTSTNNCSLAGLTPIERRDVQTGGAACTTGPHNPGGWCPTDHQEIVVMRRHRTTVAIRCSA